MADVDVKQELGETDYGALMGFIFESQAKGTHYAGQSYEDGLLAVVDLLEGNTALEDIL